MRNFLFIVITVIVLSACELNNNEPQEEVVNNNNNYNDDMNNGSEELDAQVLLEESFAAMQQVNSLYMATELNVVEQNEGEEKTGYRIFDVAMIIVDHYSIYYFLNIDNEYIYISVLC